MDRLIIHLGLHKTGTTAVQRFLEDNAVKLRRGGVAHIPLERMRKEITPLFHEAGEGSGDAARRYLEGFPAPTVILSDENILGGTNDVPTGQFYPAARRRVTAVLEALGETEVHLVVTLRDPAQLLPSMYAEYLRMRDFVDFDAYAAKLDLTSLSYWESFGWLRSLPPNVTAHILAYEDRFGRGVAGVAATILKLALGSSVGFDLRTFYEGKIRTSFSAEEIELATLVAVKAGGKIARLMLRNMGDHNARFGERRYSPIEPSVAAALTQRYEEDLARFGMLPSAG
jgi:hypothetical protein